MRIGTRLGQGSRALPGTNVARKRLRRIGEVWPAAAGGVRKGRAVARVDGAYAQTLGSTPLPASCPVCPLLGAHPPAPSPSGQGEDDELAGAPVCAQLAPSSVVILPASGGPGPTPSLTSYLRPRRSATSAELGVGDGGGPGMRGV